MQSSLFVIAKAKPILCKDSASRMQSSLFAIAKAMPILCKNSASRT